MLKTINKALVLRNKFVVRELIFEKQKKEHRK